MTLLDLLFPPRCIFCRKPSRESPCPACQETLPWLGGRQKAGVLAPLVYTRSVRAALLRFKFGGQMGSSRVFARFICQLLRDEGASADTVTWVPCSFFRRHRRGYDQCREIARAVAAELSLPCERLLAKTRHTKSQREMSGPEERRANVRGAFTARGEVSGRRIILIDDIYTTGATMNECRETLLAAGAREVFCAAAARRGAAGSKKDV